MLPETFKFPANVLVAVVLVALIEATCGVEVEVRLPEASNPASILAKPEPRFREEAVSPPLKAIDVEVAFAGNR